MIGTAVDALAKVAKSLAWNQGGEHEKIAKRRKQVSRRTLQRSTGECILDVHIYPKRGDDRRVRHCVSCLAATTLLPSLRPHRGSKITHQVPPSAIASKGV